jgi:hypothetical protein
VIVASKIFSVVGALAWCLLGSIVWFNAFLDFEQYGPVPFSKYLLSISPVAAVVWVLPVIGTGISIAAFSLVRNGNIRLGTSLAVLSFFIASLFVALSIGVAMTGAS